MAPIQRGQRAKRTVRAGAEVAERYAGRNGSDGVLLAGETHDAAHRLSDQIEAAAIAVRTGMPEPGDRAIDQTRVERMHRVIAEPETIERAGSEVLDEDVRRCRQRAHQCRALGALQVDRDRAFVAIDEVERPERTGFGFATGFAIERLDLDHVGAEIGEQHRAISARNDVGTVDRREYRSERRACASRDTGGSMEVTAASVAPRSARKVRRYDGFDTSRVAATEYPVPHEQEATVTCGNRECRDYRIDRERLRGDVDAFMGKAEQDRARFPIWSLVDRTASRPSRVLPC